MIRPMIDKLSEAVLPDIVASRLSRDGEPTQHESRPMIDRVSHPTDVGPVVLSTRGLTVAYRREPVLENIDLDLPGGRLIAVVGPNGAGKSTLIKAWLDLAPKSRGEVRVLGEKYRKVRRRVGYVPQRESVDWDFPVSALDVVAMGLYGRIGWCRPVTRKYKRMALEAMEHVGIAELAHRQISQLSGGQQQRVFLARALAQDAELYLMDEPFAAVDAATESAIVDVLRELRQTGRTCVVVHHDLATVPKYFDHVVLLNRTLVAAGPTAETFTADNLQTTYGGKLVTFPDAPRRVALQVA